MYKVKEEDLIGDIKDFPIEVVQKMVEEQVRQGNPADVSVFQLRITDGRYSGGFYWAKTTDGDAFWRRVIMEKNFDLFFDKYPKEHEDDFWIDPKGRRMLVWDHNENDAQERIVIAKLPNTHFPYIAVSITEEDIFLEGKKHDPVIFKHAKPIPEKEEAVELTLDQIAEKFGVKVEQLKIKK